MRVSDAIAYEDGIQMSMAWVSRLAVIHQGTRQLLVRVPRLRSMRRSAEVVQVGIDHSAVARVHGRSRHEGPWHGLGIRVRWVCHDCCGVTSS